MKSLSTVNVIQFEGDMPTKVISFNDTTAGNKKAEKVFADIVESIKGESVSDEEMSNYLEDGYWLNSVGHSVYIIHSEQHFSSKKS